MWKKIIRSELINYFEKIQTKNPRFSLRSLSKKIQISPGSLSDIIHNKRLLTVSNAEKILEILPLDKNEKLRLRRFIQYERKKERLLLPEEAKLMLENWHYFAILNLLELDTPPKGISELAERLGLTKSLAQKAIDDLIQFKFIVNSPNGYQATGQMWRSTDEISSDSVKKSHKQSLELAEKAIDEIPLQERDITSITFAGNPESLIQVKKDIRKFMEKTYGKMSQKNITRVYKLNIQLFPIDLGLADQKKNPLK